jgi:hypothetical protein
MFHTHSESEVRRRVEREMRIRKVDEYWIYSSRGIIIPNNHYNESEEEIREFVIAKMDREQDARQNLVAKFNKPEKVCWLREGF